MHSQNHRMNKKKRKTPGRKFSNAGKYAGPVQRPDCYGNMKSHVELTLPEVTQSTIMDASRRDIKFPLRILVDKEKSKVVFAEVQSDFVDTLFSFLTLPMGTIVRLLKNYSELRNGAIRNFRTLYASVENLQAKYLASEECKEMLLNPRNAAEAQCRQLKMNMDDSMPTRYFICENWECSRRDIAYLSTYNTAKCNCGKLMDRALSVNSDVKTVQSKGEVFVTGTESYIVSDDLCVYPNQLTIAFELLKKCGIIDPSTLDELTLDVGFEEMLNVLNSSFHSNSPLTDAFLFHGLNVSVFPKIGQSQIEVHKITNNTMTIKVVFQKSSNKVLFVEAGKEFVDFLFSFLTIPLGGVACLLNGNIAVGSVGNLYNSVSMLKFGRYIKSQELKEMLLSPKLALLHKCKNQMFCLDEANAPQYYCYSSGSNSQYTGYLTSNLIYSSIDYYRCTKAMLRNPKLEDEFIKIPEMYMVTDDLFVSPSSCISNISFLQRLKVSLSDVEEQVMSIGMEEALKILKTSLESTSVFTSAFFHIPAKPGEARAVKL